MNSYFSDAGIFLIDVLFGFIILMVMLRFILQWVRADFYNPISQFIVKVTNPVLRPLRRLIPAVGGMDTASIVLMLLLKYIQLFLTFALAGYSVNPIALVVLSLTSLLEMILYIFIIAIIVIAIASWIAPGGYNPVLNLLNQLTRPILRPVQRLIRPVSGLDLSPLVALIILNLLLLAIPHINRALMGMF